MARRRNTYHGWAAGDPARRQQVTAAQQPNPNSPGGPGTFTYAGPQQAQPTFDAAFEIGKTNLGAARDNALAQDTYGEGRAASDYGFTLNRDPTTGFATAGAVDLSNPFSKMSLLQRSYETAKRGTSNQYASMGQGFSGAFNTQQAENTRGYQQGYDSLTKAFADILQGYTQDRLGATNAYNTGVGNLNLQKLLGLTGGY